MSHSLHNKISSISSFKKTIFNDRHTYSWFKYLLLTPEIKQTLSQNKTAVVIYGKIKNASLSQAFLVIICILLFLLNFYKKQPLFLAVLVIIFIFLFKIYCAQKSHVQELALMLIQDDFKEDSLEQNTLYQITEYYSKKWAFPSFVSYMFKADQISRTSLAVSFLFFLFILPIGNSLHFTLVVLLVLYCVNLFTGSFYFFEILKRLKN